MARYGIGHSAAGRYTTFPDVFVNIRKDALDLRPVTAFGVVAVLAEGAGFAPPQVATSLQLGSQAIDSVLTTSTLLTTAKLAAKPFNDLGRGAGEVIVVPVNLSTKSTKALNSSTPTLLATLTSKGYGLLFNTVLVKSETLKVTITLPTSNGGVISEEYTYTNIADLVDQINRRSGIVDATFAAEGTMATYANTAMTGGTEPAAVNADWAAALQALNGRRITAIHAASSSLTVQAMVADYAILKRCRFFYGTALKTWNGLSNRQASITTLKADAAAINAIRGMHVGLGADGQPGYIYAARYAALAAALEPSVPMTFKHLDAQSLEARLDKDTEVGGIDGLHLAGVAPPVPDPDAPSTFLVSRGLSCYTGSDNLYDREHSVLAAVDGIWDQIEAGMRTFLGNEGTPATIARAIALVDQILRDATRPTATVRINSYRPESIHAEISGMVLTISAAFTPIPPINFVDVYLNLERTELTQTFQVPLAA
jgi:hypothetical protein